MTTKDTDSMATVQIKPDYAASEVYSTASEAPPAYKRQSNSVKIAKITAFTIIASSFILGAFILASSYLEAKASCDQVQALDSVLEKELMLETLQQVNKELPRAEALLGKENSDESELQNLDSDTTVKKVELKKQQSAKEDDTNDDNSYSDVEEVEDKYPGKVPLELDLSDLAAALLQNNKKSRMNCVVERKHAEEIVDSPSKTVSLPFGVNLTTDPKKARITGERISIYCEGGNENKEQQEGARDSMRNNNNHEEDDDNEDDAEPLRPMFIPYQRIPIPFGQIPERFPLTHMPQRMMPPMMGAPQQHMQHMQQPFIRQMPPPFQQLPMRPPMPPQVMQAPEPESHSQNMLEMQQPQTVRIHVQQIPIREIHVADDVPVQIPSQHQQPKVQIVSLPLSLALQRAGITAEDLRNIQRMAEDRFIDEIKRLGGEESDELSEINNNSNSDEGDDNSSDTQMSDEQHEQRQQQQQERQQQPQPQPLPQQQQLPELPRPQQPAINPEEVASRNAEQVPVQRLILQPLPEQPRDTMTPPMPDQPQMMQYGRAAFGRSLAQPVRIPVPMMHAREESESAVMGESERPHFVQPRSV